MTSIQVFVFTLILCFAKDVFCKDWHQELNILVPARKEECFFLPNVSKDQVISVEFQVIRSSTNVGNNIDDIIFRLFNPIKQTVVLFQRRNEGRYDTQAKTEGDFRACFDNLYSTFASKTVHVGFSVSDTTNPYFYDDYIDQADLEQMKIMDIQREIEFQMSVDQIKEKIKKIRSNIASVDKSQNFLLLTYSVDYGRVVNTRFRCDLFGLVQVCLMTIVSFLQVFFVKRLFSTSHSSFNT